MQAVLLVPRGAEEQAVRKAAPLASVVAIRAGASAAQLPDTLPGGPIVVMGLCGALRRLRTGGCVLYASVQDEGGRITFDRELIDAFAAALPVATLAHGFTLDHVVTRAAERVALAAAYDADVVDMESAHVARALAARGRPCLVVRIVSDDPSYDLPPIENAFGPDGEIRPLHLARAFLAKPLAARRFIRDARRSLTVLGQTAATLTQQ